MAARKKGDRPKLITSPGCRSRHELHLERHTFGGHAVTLQARTLDAFAKVYDRIDSRLGRHSLWIASSYRSCAEQRAICERICGDPVNGCPGLAAAPGHSQHNIGNAVDAGAVHPRDVEEVRRAFYAFNFHNFASHDGLKASGSDPWHFSFRVTG